MNSVAMFGVTKSFGNLHSITALSGLVNHDVFKSSTRDLR